MNPTKTMCARLPGGALAVLALALLLPFLGACERRGEAAQDEHGEHGGEAGGAHAEETARGPHGGRLLAGGTLALELQIEENGIEPEFRAWLSDPKGKALPLADARGWVVLERFGGRRDSIALAPDGARLRGVRPVVEPHSYTAHVTVLRGGQRHEWTFRQEEGRLELEPESVAAAGIESAVAGPRLIEVRAEAPGEIRLNGERVVQVRPRFPGVLRSLRSRLGETVRAGETIAVVLSNESLADYEIAAPMSGSIVSRDAAEGQAVDASTAVYTIADLGSVWVDFALPPRIASSVRRGQPVRIRSEIGETLAADGAVSYVGPLLEQDTRVSYGRAVLPNAGQRWKPGLFVTAEVLVDRVRAAVAVPEEAILRTSRGPAVFRADGATFELQPVVPGRSDGLWTEIREGLEPGARVVVRNAFLLKAELGKSEATHDH